MTKRKIKIKNKKNDDKPFEITGIHLIIDLLIMNNPIDENFQRGRIS